MSGREAFTYRRLSVMSETLLWRLRELSLPPARCVETPWKRRVQQMAVPAASTMSPRTGLISAVSRGLARTSNAVVSDGATTAYDHNSHAVS
jgi:hypothetical protein